MALPKIYDKTEHQWHNNTTPSINEDELNAISEGLSDIDDRVIDLAGTLMETVPEIIALYDDIRQLTEYPPYIGENGDWYVWDTDEDEFVDSGVQAQGETGVGIQSIEKTGTSGLVDTYTITFTDGSTTTFTVTNASSDIDNAKVNGAVNMLPNKATTQTINGITFTVNSDGTISASGTATANTELTLNTSGSSSPISGLETNNYKLSGCPSGGGSNTHRLFVKGTSNSYYNDDGSGVLINNDGIAYVRIWIKSGQTVSNLVFKPMLSLASLNLSYDDYVPYAKSNKELTADVELVNLPCTLNSSYVNTGEVYATKVGKLVIMSGYFHVSTAASRNTALITLPSGIKPYKGNVYGIGIRDNDTITRLRLNNNNIVADATNGASVDWYNIMMSFLTQ